MKAFKHIWYPVFRYENLYEVNVLDGIVREKSRQDSTDDKLLIAIPIEEGKDETYKFHGFGFELKDSSGKKELLPTSRIVAEAVLRKEITKPIYFKNGINLDCNFNNLTFVPHKPYSEMMCESCKDTVIYQYKLVKQCVNGKINQFYAFDRQYKNTEAFEKATALSRGDFLLHGVERQQFTFGIYMYSLVPLDIAPLVQITPTKSIKQTQDLGAVTV